MRLPSSVNKSSHDKYTPTRYCGTPHAYITCITTFPASPSDRIRASAQPDAPLARTDNRERVASGRYNFALFSTTTRTLPPALRLRREVPRAPCRGVIHWSAALGTAPIVSAVVCYAYDLVCAERSLAQVGPQTTAAARPTSSPSSCRRRSPRALETSARRSWSFRRSRGRRSRRACRKRPLRSTPIERSQPQRVALLLRPSTETSRPPPRSAQLRRQGCQVVNVTMQHWMVRSARVPAARVWRLSTSLSAPVLSFCD